MYSDDDLSVSSEDSVNLDDASTSGPRHAPFVPNRLPDSSKLNNYGIGGKLMMDMGYIDGMGLGASNSGITEPVDVKIRPKYRGLGNIPQSPEYGGDQAVEQSRRVDRQFKETLVHDLQNVLDFISAAKNPIFLDLLDFYRKFRYLPNWYDDRLWEVLEIAAYKQLGGLNSLQEFGSEEVHSMLIILSQELPNTRYASLVNNVWYSRVEKDLARDNSLLSTVMSQVLELHETLEPTLPQLSSFLADSLFEDLVESTQNLRKYVSVMPSLKRALYNACLRNHYNTLAIQRLCTILSPQDTLELFRRQISNSRVFSECASTLKAWSAVLSSQGVYNEAATDFVLPLWLDELYSRLTSNSFSLEWWLYWRELLPETVESHDRFKLQALNAINTYFDTGYLLREPATSIETQFGDALRIYCAANDYQLTFSENIREGRIQGKSGKPVVFKIVDDILYVSSRKNLEPISLFDLEEYLSSENGH